jgi:hypothetical protein
MPVLGRGAPSVSRADLQWAWHDDEPITTIEVKMKTVVIVCTCIMLCEQAAIGRTSPVPAGGDTPLTLTQIIQRIMNGGLWEGQMDKQLQRAGDGAAVVISKVISDRSLSDVEIETVLDMLERSFAEPSWIQTPDDRQPRTTLLIVRYLQSITLSQGLRAKAATVRKNVLQHALVEPSFGR